MLFSNKISTLQYKFLAWILYTGILLLLLLLCNWTIPLSAFNSLGFTEYSVNIYYLLFAIILIPLNILFESLKLYYKLHISISLLQCIRQVCKGFSFNLILPFGIGTYAGRTVHSNNNISIDIIKITAISSLSQTFCNLLAGIILGLPFLGTLLFLDSLDTLSIPIISTLILVFPALFLYGLDHFKNSFLSKVKSKIFQKINYTWNSITIREWVVITGLSFLRYIVYLTQGVFILIFIANIDFLQAISCISVYLMLLSLIYLPGIFSILSRTAIACLVFSGLIYSNEQAICFSWLIFLLNALIPAMFGFYYLLEDSIQKHI